MHTNTIVSHADLRDILRACWFTPANDRGDLGLPVLIIGDPGTGKTSMLQAEARALGLPSLVLIGSITDPTDFGGYPSPPADGSQFATMLLPNWVRTVFGWGEAGGVIILDELTCVAAAQQAAMLRMVLERYAGQYKFMPRVRFVAAANPTEQAAGGSALSMPMANRFAHIEVERPGLDDWFDILDGRFYEAAPIVDPTQLEASSAAAFAAEYEQARIRAKAFLRRRPELAQQTPKAGSVESEGAWASLRTWEFAMRAMGAARVHGLTEAARDALIAAYLGQGVAVQFTSWLREADLPEASEVLDGRVAWAPSPMRPDRTSAVLHACAATVLRTSDRDTKVARARRLWSLLSGLTDTPDLGLEACTLLSGDDDILMLPEAAQARRAMLEVSRAVKFGGIR